MSNVQDNVKDQEPKRKKTPKKEKETTREIKPKYYSGTKIEKLKRVPKGYLNDLNNVEALTPEQLEKYYSAIILGLIPDRFGLEVSIDEKLKAAKGLSELRQNKLKEQAIQNMEEQEAFAIDFVIKQKQQVDEMTQEEQEEDFDADH